RQLLVLLDGSWDERRPAPVTNSVAARQSRNLRTDRLRPFGAQIGAARVETLVALELPGEVLGKCLEKVLSRPWPEEEQVRPDPAGAGLPRLPHDLLHQLRPVGDAGQE